MTKLIRYFLNNFITLAMMHYASGAFSGVFSSVDECRKSLTEKGYYVASDNIFHQVFGLNKKEVGTLENMFEDPMRASSKSLTDLSGGEISYIKSNITRVGFEKSTLFGHPDAVKVPSPLYWFSDDSPEGKRTTHKLMYDEKKVFEKMASSIAGVINQDSFVMKVLLLLNNQPELKIDPYHHNFSYGRFSPEYIIFGVLNHDFSWGSYGNHLGSTKTISKQKIGVVDKDHQEIFSRKNYKEDSDSKCYRYVAFNEEFEEQKGSGYIINQIPPLSSDKIIVHQREPREASVASRLTAEIRICSLEGHPDKYRINDATNSEDKSFILINLPRDCQNALERNYNTIHDKQSARGFKVQ